jgi:hypothetical protein
MYSNILVDSEAFKMTLVPKKTKQNRLVSAAALKPSKTKSVTCTAK